MHASATLRNYRVSPRKIRLIAGLLRGKRVPQALDILTHLPKGSSAQIRILLRSAIANAKQHHDLSPEQLIISAITVDMAQRLKRFTPKAMGRANPILKHASHITITVKDAPAAKVKKVKAQAKTEKPKAKTDVEHVPATPASAPSPSSQS
ncbi:MAG: 50S ribosomal protein L22 [Patescibacteria group bacterium]